MEIRFQSKGDFNQITKWLDDVAQRNPSATLNKIASQGVKSLASNTPKDTGKTASGWSSEVTTKGATSEVAWKNTAHPETSVNIATIIDQGHGTGTGGYVAPRPYIKQAMESVWKTAGDDIVKELIK